jgi:hypothetical protein
MRKDLAIELIIILVIDLASCSTYREFTAEEDFENHENGDDILVLGIRSRIDGLILFNEKYPGKIENGQVTGLPQKHLPYSATNSIIYDKRDAIPAYILNNGIRYKIVTQNRSGFICVSSDTVRIPFSEIDQVNVKEKDSLKTTLMVMGLSSVLMVMIGYLISSHFEIYTQGM